MTKIKKLKKDPRGGARIGAGRPKTGLQSKLKTISIDPICYDFLLKTSKENQKSIKNTVQLIANFWLTNQEKSNV
jgi:hypothetical protein